jgi:hypothetical protein
MISVVPTIDTSLLLSLFCGLKLKVIFSMQTAKMGFFEGFLTLAKQGRLASCEFRLFFQQF